MRWTAGSDLKPFTLRPLTREEVVAYAQASRDYNPIHVDENFAKASGFPSVIVHGMLSMAFLADFVGRNFPESEFDVIRIKTRFRKVTFPGDVLKCEGKVKTVAPDGKILLTFSAVNQNGEVTADGDAEVVPRA